MNPENKGEQIGLHHSYLWRKSMFVNNDGEVKPSCHRQLNDLATTGQSWRTRNNFIHSNLNAIKNHSLKSRRSEGELELETLLREEDQFSNKKRSLLKSIRPDASSLEKHSQLIEGMRKLREIGLLDSKDMHHVKFPGIIKIEHVYNDYHLREANPGFSRNYLGKFYTK